MYVCLDDAQHHIHATDERVEQQQQQEHQQQQQQQQSEQQQQQQQPSCSITSVDVPKRSPYIPIFLKLNYLPLVEALGQATRFLVKYISSDQYVTIECKQDRYELRSALHELFQVARLEYELSADGNAFRVIPCSGCISQDVFEGLIAQVELDKSNNRLQSTKKKNAVVQSSNTTMSLNNTMQPHHGKEEETEEKASTKDDEKKEKKPDVKTGQPEPLLVMDQNKSQILGNINDSQNCLELDDNGTGNKHNSSKPQQGSVAEDKKEKNETTTTGPNMSSVVQKDAIVPVTTTTTHLSSNKKGRADDGDLDIVVNAAADASKMDKHDNVEMAVMPTSSIVFEPSWMDLLINPLGFCLPDPLPEKKK